MSNAIQSSHRIRFTFADSHRTELLNAQIEKETLAAVFGMEHFENYTYGRHVTIQSDHNPLEKTCIVHPSVYRECY